MSRKAFSLSELATLTASRLVGDPQIEISDVADLDSAKQMDASFLSNARYAQSMHNSEAGVIFVTPQTKLLANKNFLINDNPSKAFQQVVDLFYSDSRMLSGFQGIHSSAVIHETAKIGRNVQIGPHAVIDQEASIGDDTFIGAGTYIGPNSRVGQQCQIHPHVTIRENCFIGNHVIIQPGAVIGSCGFGYHTDAQGKHTKLNQVGSVTIEDCVEIGANTTIDRARFKTTKIGRGTKLDNLIQIAHGVELGPDNIFAAQTGIAGSTSTGRCVMSGGQVAIAGHIEIGSGVMIAAKSGVSKTLSKAGKYNGIPAMPLNEYNRNAVYLRNIEKYIEQIKSLEERLNQLEQESIISE